jgi:hypothetical protein
LAKTSSRGLDGWLYDVEAGFGNKWYVPIRNYILQRAIEDTSLDETLQFNPEFYVQYENSEVPGDLLRRAQIRIVKIIRELFNSENDEKVARDWIDRLIYKSQKFSQKFLVDLTKHYGVNAYLDTMDQAMRGPNKLKPEHFFWGTILEKPKLDIFDVAQIFNHIGYDVSNEQMQQILEKATDRAKEYMRGLLYGDNNYSSKDDTGEFFILDAEMQPINKNYKQRPWPQQIGVFKPSKILQRPDLQEWRQIFQDFEIVTQ